MPWGIIIAVASLVLGAGTAILATEAQRKTFSFQQEQAEKAETARNKLLADQEEEKKKALTEEKIGIEKASEELAQKELKLLSQTIEAGKKPVETDTQFTYIIPLALMGMFFMMKRR